MTRDELKFDYFDWMYGLVCDTKYPKKLSYRKLLNFLHNMDFTYQLTMDSNRFEDGIELRYRFGYENGYDCSVIANYLDSLIVMEGTVLDMMDVYEDLDNYIIESGYDVRCFGYDPYNAKDFVERWTQENGVFGVEKVIQGAKTESVPLGELKKLSEDRMLLFDEELMTFTMGNCITLEDTNGNRKLLKKRYDQKIDAVAAMMDAYVAYKLNRDMFE